ncbi:helix-turn-helix transcriptional regulator [Frankia sp. R82]|uniref:ArsR/SmtB family transcription factor n=1 Tax=Frankia sp. R82 TaxID=2950553 RepID=UPI002042F772|nr:metalloregulator ArsR/SmtB family transcription factor [Frankia sp. R82]MCM3886449.1 metalloregulator ArsR/SmtB family transcription factor [Frankia sp. R82]
MVVLASSAEVLARFGHALSDPTRARLLLVLRSGGAYPSELAEALGVSRTNLSNHLACLRGCGLVVATPEGRRQRYELADDKLHHALGDLLDVVLAVDPDHLHTFVADLDVADLDVDPSGPQPRGVTAP